MMTIHHERKNTTDVRVITRNPDGTIHEKAVIGLQDAHRLAAQDRVHGFKRLTKSFTN